MSLQSVDICIRHFCQQCHWIINQNYASCCWFAIAYWHLIFFLFICTIDRRGEEHSFILKPVMTSLRHSKVETDCSKRRPSRISTRTYRSSQLPSSTMEWRDSDPPAVRYAVLVSCRCNYTGSKAEIK